MVGTRIPDFDTWRPGYGQSTIRIYRAATTILADIFEDEDCTVPANNPQQLVERTVGETIYGKFVRPIYTRQPYSIGINSIENTGIERPALTTLEDQDASKALVTPTGAPRSVSLEDLAVRRVDVRSYGSFLILGSPTASAAANTAAINLAVGAVAGGGRVMLPAGVYQVDPLSLPLNVMLEGQAAGVTTLQCTQGGRIITLGGNNAGLARLTLDGLSKASTSVGVYSLARRGDRFEDVEIKRFEVGYHKRGGEFPSLMGLSLSDCSYGARLHGDKAATESGLGTTIVGTSWTGGRVEFCSIAGVELKYVDLPCINTRITGILFYQNTGTAVRIEGARAVTLTGCVFDTNAVNLDVADPVAINTLNTVQDVLMDDCRFKAGRIKFKDTAENVVFRRCSFEDVEVTLTIPKNAISVQDSRESNVTLLNSPTSWLRSRTTKRGASTGVTTGAAPTKVWGLTMVAGQRGYFIATAIARGRNVMADGFYLFTVSARRPPAFLNYEVQTGQYTVGNVLTGAVSGANARIVADTDSGTVGVLRLQDINGTFVDNEIATDGATGSATVNGSVGLNPVELAGTVQNLREEVETYEEWGATFVANGPELEVRVTGSADVTLEWTVDVEVVGP